MRTLSRWPWVAAALGMLGVVLLLAYVYRSSNRAHEAAASTLDASDPVERLDGFCAHELELIGGGCFAAPSPRGAGPVPLLVYLHGRYGDATAHEELERQSRVARLAIARGFAVLAVRGARGECNAPELVDWYCWPSNERNASDGSRFAARVAHGIEQARTRIGEGPNVLLGFSNGGYFATLIATRALGPFEAIAIAHGGPVQPTQAQGRQVPLLLITADDDPSDPEMQRLDGELSQANWPHAFVGREGGHDLPDWDVNMALTFFIRVRTERVPLVPPLATHIRRPSTLDAEVDAEIETSAPEEGGED